MTNPEGKMELKPMNISKLPWVLGSLDRPWEEFIERCNKLSPDKDNYMGYSIVAENREIVCLFGPGPKSYDNAKFIMDCIYKSSHDPSQEKVRVLREAARKAESVMSDVYRKGLVDCLAPKSEHSNFTLAITALREALKLSGEVGE